MNTPSTVKNLAARYAADTITHRRTLHAAPELSFQERETSAYIARTLTDWGIDCVSGIGGYGVVATIPGGSPGPVVVLRADMDALPITEQTGLPFASTRPGVMHACGHDAHVACLLTAARILQQIREQFGGVIRLIFQPAEEKLPGGAQAMIRDGVLTNPVPTVAVGQHINPTLPTGVIGFRSGLFMASVDDLFLRIRGSGGHAANPDQLVDPVTIAAQIILSLQQVSSRLAPPEVPTVLSIGQVIAGGATNVIPTEVTMEGTFRTVDETWRMAAHDHIRRIATRTAEAMNGTCEVEIQIGYPSLMNDLDLTARIEENARLYVGAERVQPLPLTMGGEDFAYYGRALPGCFYNLGVCPPDRLERSEPLHSPRLVVDEAALEVGAGFLAWNAVRELQHAAAAG
ncbi:MAG: amidohydrolase [Spirochaetaceae bacterium]|nr:MAG: amidohydrolase [Spirochaetaceae bacterium]